ncbi:hypothetical protein [Sagittula sp. SSi028]|uniref:hypothetical protein n=1 Tax=Sagittula sp. SSi028 TaxID=3400636 RepID=UPI003AF43D91
MLGLVECQVHGRQGIGLVCEHIAHAVDGDNPKVGFFHGNEIDTARPDAWCRACEDSLIELDGDQGDRWFDNADFKVFCQCCWDEAAAVCK